MTQNILITGWLGYIGSHAVVALQEAGHTPIIIDNLSNCESSVHQRLEQLTNTKIRCHVGDIRDGEFLRSVFEAQPIDAVIHFAAMKSVSESMEIPFEYYDNNVNGSITLTRIMDEYKVRHLIFSSTCAVYSPACPAPYDETMPTAPESIYAMTKLMMEQAFIGLAKVGKLSVAMLRYFNPIGNHPSGTIGELPQWVPQNLMPYLMQVVQGQREYLSVYGDNYPTSDGTCIRDYIHVMDLVEAHVKTLDRLTNQEEDICEIINLGTGKGTSVLEMIHAVEEVIWQTLPYKIVDRRSGDLPEVYGNVTKAKKILWRETTRSIADGVRDMVKFYG